MKKVSLFLNLVVLAAFAVESCNQSIKEEVNYKEVTIGKQVWMTKNLRVDKFLNGDPIPEAKTDEEWNQAGKNKQPAWCYYENNPSNDTLFGKLYNFYAVSDSRGLVPKGWRVPTENDFTILLSTLPKVDEEGFMGVDGTGLITKEFWDSNSGTNISGFSAVASGLRWQNFEQAGGSFCIWLSSLNYNNNVLSAFINSAGQIGINISGETSGYSIRCVRDLDPTEVKIGNQKWMAENLNIEKFRNGDHIPEAKTDEEWRKAREKKQPAWCYYGNNSSNGSKFGKLYNWFAVNDPRGLAPGGYHIPTDLEWNILIDFLGGKMIAGKKMKSIYGWQNGSNGSNESDFLGLPGGSCDYYGSFSNIDREGWWWSSTEFDEGLAWCLGLQTGTTSNSRQGAKGEGLYVRCIKD